MSDTIIDTTNTLAKMLIIRKTWANEGLQVVFTNGCFDLLHPGHIRYLTDAKALGDRLIVGLNDDASVRRLKGGDKHCPRPLNPLHDRMSMLSGLRMVDAVIPFSEDTPFNLITALLPDILVKGGDYTLDAIVGADVVQQSGGSVVVVPFLDGYSSSRLIQRIQSAQNTARK